ASVTPAARAEVLHAIAAVVALALILGVAVVALFPALRADFVPVARRHAPPAVHGLGIVARVAHPRHPGLLHDFLEGLQHGLDRAAVPLGFAACRAQAVDHGIDDRLGVSEQACL